MLPEILQSVPVAAALEDRNTAWITAGKLDRGGVAIEIAPDAIVAVCRFLKAEQKFVRLDSVTALDWYPQEPRFEVVYHLHSLDRNERLRLKCKVGGEQPEIDSICEVWRAANWFEREVFDLFGISFRNHPNMTRILMPEGWDGNPLRKDYPIHGHKYSYAEE